MPEFTPAFKNWLHAIFIAVVLFIFLLSYNLLYRQGQWLVSFSESLAASGGFLIGFSFIVAPLSYFFDFADKELRYRKYLGLVGYFFALLYSFSLQIRFPDRYFYGLFDSLLFVEVILGLMAMTIFTVMAMISNAWGTKVLGGKLWRSVLRLGYVAYFLLIVRAYLIEHQIWVEWINTLQGLPPPRLVLSVFAGVVILARIVMVVVQMIEAKSHK